MKIREIHIDNFKIFDNFDVSFCKDNKPLPIIVLAGINGSGKTTLLNFIKDILDYYKNNNIEKNNSKTKVLVHPLNNMNSIEIEANDSKINVINITPENEYKFKVSKIIITEYIDKLIYEKDYTGSEAYKYIEEKLKSFFTHFNLQIEFNKLDRNKNIFFKNSNNDKISIDDLSSGEKTLISKLFPLYISDISNSIILFDEPEDSLHPNWQFEIVNILTKIAIEKNCQIVLATHSPFIVGSINQENIKLLVNDNNKIKVIENFTKSYGKTINDILLEFFQIKGLRTPAIVEKMDKCNLLIAEKKYKSDEFLQILVELEKILGEDDNDIILIKLEINRIDKDFLNSEQFNNRKNLF